MTTDFAQLYLQLGIANDCSLEEFKQACRRRITQQHPDRLQAGDTRDGTQLPLSELLALYAKALRFHRRHGRLPGAVAPTPAVGSGLRSPVPLLVTGDTHPLANNTTKERSRRISPRIPLLVLATTLVGFAVASVWNDDRAQREAANPQDNSNPPGNVEAQQTPATGQSIPQAVSSTEHAGQPVVAPPRLIEIGMDAETVRSIQGDPMQWEGSEWIYGPSWIRFDRGRVIDWYSSPLHRLRTETSSP